MKKYRQELMIVAAYFLIAAGIFIYNPNHQIAFMFAINGLLGLVIGFYLRYRFNKKYRPNSMTQNVPWFLLVVGFISGLLGLVPLAFAYNSIVSKKFTYKA